MRYTIAWVTWLSILVKALVNDIHPMSRILYNLQDVYTQKR